MKHPHSPPHSAGHLHRQLYLQVSAAGAAAEAPPETQEQRQQPKRLHPPEHLQRAKQGNPRKMAPSALIETSSIQRRLFAIFYLYAILVISLYLSYVAYQFYQQRRFTDTSNQHGRLSEPAIIEQAADRHSGAELSRPETVDNNAKQDLETKIRLLERYIDVIALDLQETNKRMREREKCDCSVSCTFNGTRYADRSSWQSQCDICTCQSGRISCLPQKCPASNCDDAVLLPGQCCPTCMKKCKYNDKLVRHGQKFKPLDSSRKECKCQDGLIKCEQVSPPAQANLPAKRRQPSAERRSNATSSADKGRV